MQITNNVTTTKNVSPQNFTAIRIIKAKPEELTEFAKNFKDFCNKNTVFRAESFYHSNFYDGLNELAVRENQPMSWVIKNAENNGLINIKNLEDLPTYIFTGIDNLKLKIFTLKDIFSSFRFGLKKGIELKKQNYPSHLINVKFLKDFADYKQADFNSFVKKNHGLHVSFEEFLQEIADKKL